MFPLPSYQYNFHIKIEHVNSSQLFAASKGFDTNNELHLGIMIVPQLNLAPDLLICKLLFELCNSMLNYCLVAEIASFSYVQTLSL